MESLAPSRVDSQANNGQRGNSQGEVLHTEHHQIWKAMSQRSTRPSNGQITCPRISLLLAQKSVTLVTCPKVIVWTTAKCGQSFSTRCLIMCAAALPVAVIGDADKAMEIAKDRLSERFNNETESPELLSQAAKDRRLPFVRIEDSPFNLKALKAELASGTS